MFAQGFEKTAGLRHGIEQAARKIIPGYARSSAKAMVKKHRGARIMKSTGNIGRSHTPAQRMERFLAEKKI